MNYLKIAINKSHGGFGLSKIARDYLAKQGFEHAIRSKFLDPELSSGYYDWTGSPYYNVKSYNSMDEVEFRTHPLVIQAVEELGEKANAPGAALKIANIKLNITIDMCDGKERVDVDGFEPFED